nr:DUF1304 family protein [Prevotella dentasini]
MQTLIQILATLSALEHLYIMLLETVLTTSATTARVFSISADELRQPAVRTLFRNQASTTGFLPSFSSLPCGFRATGSGCSSCWAT